MYNGSNMACCCGCKIGMVTLWVTGLLSRFQVPQCVSEIPVHSIECRFCRVSSIVVIATMLNCYHLAVLSWLSAALSPSWNSLRF